MVRFQVIFKVEFKRIVDEQDMGGIYEKKKKVVMDNFQVFDFSNLMNSVVIYLDGVIKGKGRF